MLGFLGHVLQGDSKPGGGVFGFLDKQLLPQSEQDKVNRSPFGANPKATAINAIANEAHGVLQSTAKVVPEVGATISQAVTGQPTTLPAKTTPVGKFVFGDKPIQSIQVKSQGAEQSHPGGFNFLGLHLSPSQTGLAEGGLSTATDAAAFLPPVAKGVKVGVEAGLAHQASIIDKAVPRATVKDQQVLKDYSDYLTGSNPAKGQELNKLISDAREVGQKHGVDLSANATVEDRVNNANSILDQIGKDRKAVSEGGYVQVPGGPKPVPEVPAVHTIETPQGTLTIPQDEMTKLVQAKTPAEIKNIIGDVLPQELTNKLAPALAHTHDPNIIRNIIGRELSPTPLPRPAVGQDIVPPSVNTPLGPEGQGSLTSVSESGSPAAQKIANVLDEAKKTRALQEAGYTTERNARIGAAQGAGKDLQGSQGYAAELAQLKGPLAKQDYTGLSGHLSPTEQEDLFSQLRQEVKANPEIHGYADINTQAALRKVIFGEGGVPTKSELGLLQKSFGDKFAESVKGDVEAHTERLNALKTFGQKTGDLLGVPRTIMASADFSGGLRQGLALATRHPVMFAQEFAKQFKYAFSEKEYNAANQLIEEHPDYQLLRQGQVAIQDVGDKAVSEKEEQFVSNLAEKIPGLGKIVHGSNRAYTGLLNNLRARSFYNLVASARNAGVDFTDLSNQKLLKDFGTVVNTSTGRGNLGRLEAAGNALSTALFAPRLIASRLSLFDPRYYVNLEPLARKEALTTLASLGAVATTVLGLADAAGADVSKDPTNADFGKIKIGDTRLDILGGYQQYLRLGAQLAEGKKTNSTTGATTELGKGIAATRWDVLANFFQNKAAPIPSLAITALKGKDAAGNPVNYPKELLSRFTPLITQDIRDLYTHDNAVGGSSIGKPLAAAGSLFGVGLQTYSSQDNPLSTKQKTYIKTLQDQGADKATIKASTSFFQNLKEASGTKQNVDTAVNKAIADNDLPKAQQLADQYNKELAGGMQKWAEQYGEQYGNQDLQTAYNRQKIDLTPTSIQSRIKSIQSTKPY